MDDIKKGVFIEGLTVPQICSGRTCRFYRYGDQSGPDYCVIQTAITRDPFGNILHDMKKCPLHPCTAKERKGE